MELLKLASDISLSIYTSPSIYSILINGGEDKALQIEKEEKRETQQV